MHAIATTPPRTLRIALLDLYDGEANQGMACIRDLIAAHAERIQEEHGVALELTEFDVRRARDVPGLEYDVYLSSGGPGSPFDGLGTPWEEAYFRWLDRLWEHNATAPAPARKHALFICHSFQLLARHFGFAQITRRNGMSFGVMPMHQTEDGLEDPLFENLGEPFYAADFRDWQAVDMRWDRFEEIGGVVLAREKKRPHVDYERAVMAVRLSPEIAGVQFHPEANPPGMLDHFRQPKRKAHVVRHHGEEKYERTMARMSDPHYLLRTYDTVIPNFLAAATRTWLGEAALTADEATDDVLPTAEPTSALRRVA